MYVKWSTFPWDNFVQFSLLHPYSYRLWLCLEFFQTVIKTNYFIADTWLRNDYMTNSPKSENTFESFLIEQNVIFWEALCVVTALSGFFYWQWQRTLSDGIVLYLFKWLFHSLWRNRKLFRSAAFDLALLYHFVKQFWKGEQSSLLWHDVSNSGCSINRMIIKRVH